jgi:hypothetical protein
MEALKIFSCHLDTLKLKVPRSPAAPPKEKEGRRRKKQLADRKVPDRPGVVKGEGYKKKT